MQIAKERLGEAAYHSDQGSRARTSKSDLWVQILVFPLASWDPGFKSQSSRLQARSLSMFYNLSRPKFSYLSYEENDSTYLFGVL